ncbi:MAG TPA: GNAT family N-acetyltransferase [Candidatus Limiplasma sp.]|nr:GNAT family N-acetyltransferase [Candidatus Limiplasma sp.]
MAISLETRSLILRTADVAFADRMLAYYEKNKAFLEAFEPTRDPDFYTLAYQKALLAQDIEAEAKKTSYRFFIFLRDDPQTIIGTITLSNVIRGSFLSCFLGYKLDQDHVNKGYMTQAIRAVAAYAFDILGLHRIEANVMPDNLPSRRVLEKCEFQPEGIAKKYLKINGVWEDHLHMVLLDEFD